MNVGTLGLRSEEEDHEMVIAVEVEEGGEPCDGDSDSDGVGLRGTTMSIRMQKQTDGIAAELGIWMYPYWS